MKGTIDFRVERDDPEAWVVIVSDYDMEFVEALKAGVSHRDRVWDPMSKTWAVVRSRLTRLVTAAKDSYQNITITTVSPDGAEEVLDVRTGRRMTQESLFPGGGS